MKNFSLFVCTFLLAMKSYSETVCGPDDSGSRDLSPRVSAVLGGMEKFSKEKILVNFYEISQEAFDSINLDFKEKRGIKLTEPLYLKNLQVGVVNVRTKNKKLLLKLICSGTQTVTSYPSETQVQ